MQEANDFGGGGDMMMAYGGGGGGGSGGSTNGLSTKVVSLIEGIEKESSKTACGCNHGLMVEALKKFMFTSEKSEAQ